jgi:hypothetical protein
MARDQFFPRSAQTECRNTDRLLQDPFPIQRSYVSALDLSQEVYTFLRNLGATSKF